jgi:hypothetical protein
VVLPCGKVDPNEGGHVRGAEAALDKPLDFSKFLTGVREVTRDR